MSNAITVAKGSIQDYANQTGLSIPEIFMQLDGAIACDGSSSMDDHIEGYSGPTKFSMMLEKLHKIQKDHPGKLATLSFGSSVEWSLDGNPRQQHGMTMMIPALQELARFNGMGVSLFLLSDGEPTDYAGEEAVLEEAQKLFPDSHINTIFIGQAGSAGAKFMERLAKATGGKSLRDSEEMRQLEGYVTKLLGSGQ